MVVSLVCVIPRRFLAQSVVDDVGILLAGDAADGDRLGICQGAGFSQVDVYWEGTDEDTGEGDGIYTPTEQGDADAGWIAYIVARPNV